MPNRSFREKSRSTLRQRRNSVTLTESTAESSHLTRYRLFRLQSKF